MAFSIRNLSVLAYANGFTLWHYKGLGDTNAEIGRADYFKDAQDMLTSGDMILTSATEGGKILVVAASQPSVTTAPMV